MVDSVDVRSVSEFLEKVSRKHFQEERGQWVFRGQSNSAYGLVPSVARGPHTSRSRESHERSLFSIFCREALGYLADPPSDLWDWLSLAQHHQLPTRLLDWSQNPLVALYFAVADESNDGCVFALNAPKKIRAAVRAGSPFAVTKPEKFYPNILSPRIRAQEGLFVICASLDKPLETALRPDWSIERILVPRASKERLRYQLFRLGVHESSMFPDVDGLARRLRWQHGVRPAKY